MSTQESHLLQMVEKMPTFPASAHRIIELTNDVNCAPRDLVEVIEHDPILTLNVLKLINSAYFGLASEVTSVKQSVIYLGINTIKNIALSVATIGTLPKQSDIGFDMEVFWYHCLLTAAMAREVSKKYGGTDTENSQCFVSGLLHDVGKVVFAQFAANDYRICLERHSTSGQPLHEIEREIFDFSHARLGGEVARHWQLPEDLGNSIRNHHRLESLEDVSHVEKSLVAGNVLSKLLLMEEEERDSTKLPIPEIVSTWLDCDLTTLLPSEEQRAKELEKAELFIQMSGA